MPLRCDIKGYLKHLKLLHAHQSGFKITYGIGGSQRSFTNFRTFEDHVSAPHKVQNQLVNITNTAISATGMDENEKHHDQLSNSMANNLDSLVPPITGGCIQHDTLYENASKNDFEANPQPFMLGIKEQHKIPQAVLQQILDGVTILTQTRLSVLHSEVRISCMYAYT